MKSNQKHPRCKKEQLRTKTGLAEKDVKSNGQPTPPGFEVLVMMNSLQNIVISGAQGLLMLMGSKCLIKMTRPENIVFYLNVCGLVIFIKILIPSTSGSLEHVK